MGATDATIGKRLDAVAVPSAPVDGRDGPRPVGEWPERVSRWPLILSGLLWLAWAGFMLWMAILRIEGGKS